jgi:hypothetical protein
MGAIKMYSGLLLVDATHATGWSGLAAAHLAPASRNSPLERSGYKFLPLISEKLRLRCSLDILLLRPEEPRFIIKSGHLDARLKTIAFRDATSVLGSQAHEKNDQQDYENRCC